MNTINRFTTCLEPLSAAFQTCARRTAAFVPVAVVASSLFVLTPANGGPGRADEKPNQAGGPESKSTATTEKPAETGNDDGQEKNPATGKSAADGKTRSAKQVAIDTMNALRQGDKKTFLAGFDAGTAELKLLETIADLSAESLRFRKKFVDAYGAGAWRTFQDPVNQINSVHDFNFTHITAEQMQVLKEMDNAEIERSGEVALPNAAPLTKMVKKKDRWLIDARTLIPADQPINDMIGYMRNVLNVVRFYENVIGEKGVEPADLDHDMGRATDLMHGVPTDAEPKIDPALLKKHGVRGA